MTSSAKLSYWTELPTEATYKSRREWVRVENLAEKLHNYGLIIPQFSLRDGSSDGIWFSGLMDLDFHYTKFALDEQGKLIECGEMQHIGARDLSAAFQLSVKSVGDSSFDACARALPWFARALEAVKKIVAALRSRGYLAIGYFSGGKGFRILFFAREMFSRVPFTEQAASRRGQQIHDTVLVPFLNEACHCDVLSLVDDACLHLDVAPLNKRCGVKPDFIAHPKTRLFPASIDNETMIRDTVEYALVGSLRAFWGTVFAHVCSGIPSRCGRLLPIPPRLERKEAIDKKRPPAVTVREEERTVRPKCAEVTMTLPRANAEPPEGLSEAKYLWIVEDACARAHTASEWARMGQAFVKSKLLRLSTTQAADYNANNAEHVVRVALSTVSELRGAFVSAQLAEIAEETRKLSNEILLAEALVSINPLIVLLTDRERRVRPNAHFSCPVSIPNPPRNWLEFDSTKFYISREELIESALASVRTRYEAIMKWTCDHVAKYLNEQLKTVALQIQTAAKKLLARGQDAQVKSTPGHESITADLISRFPPCMRRIAANLSTAKDRGRTELAWFFRGAGFTQGAAVRFAATATTEEAKSLAFEAKLALPYGDGYSSKGCLKLQQSGGEGPRGCPFVIDIEDAAPAGACSSLDTKCRQRASKQEATTSVWSPTMYFKEAVDPLNTISDADVLGACSHLLLK